MCARAIFLPILPVVAVNETSNSIELLFSANMAQPSYVDQTVGRKCDVSGNHLFAVAKSVPINFRISCAVFSFVSFVVGGAMLVSAGRT